MVPKPLCLKPAADILEFLAQVQASDLCDTNVTITSDAPEFFQLGDTLVTFTATDDSGNSAQTAATVTVDLMSADGRLVFSAARDLGRCEGQGRASLRLERLD